MSPASTSTAPLRCFQAAIVAVASLIPGVAVIGMGHGV